MSDADIQEQILSHLRSTRGAVKVIELFNRLKESDPGIALVDLTRVISELAATGLVDNTGRGMIQLGKSATTHAPSSTPTPSTAKLPGETFNPGDKLPDTSDMTLHEISRIYQKKIQGNLVNKFAEAKARENQSEGPPAAWHIARAQEKERILSGKSTQTPSTRPDPPKDNASIDDIVRNREQAVLHEIGTQMPYMTPESFHELCMAVLRAIGFLEINEEQPGEDRLRGTGSLRSPAVSADLPPMHAAYRCIPGRNPIADSVIIALGNEITGKQDQGIILTAGGFTQEARNASVQPGTVPVILMDAMQIAHTMLEHGIGVISREVTLKEVDPEMFGEGGE